MTGLSSVAPCYRSERPTPTSLLFEIDLTRFERPRAVRSRLRQAMAGLSLDLYRRPSVRHVLMVVFTGNHPASARETTLAVAAVEGVHRQAEMRRGTPLAVGVVFADDLTPPDRVRERLRLSTRSIPDGVSAMTWPDVRAYGVHACAAAYRL